VSILQTSPVVVDPGLAIAGLARLSVCDWPGRLVATVFTQGCPWRCSYCHNPDLIDPRRPGVVAWSQVWSHLHARVGLLDGVVFSGGEPTIQAGLAAAVDRVRELGYAVGLHTSGVRPARLDGLLSRLDWVGLDVKGLPEHYPTLTGSPAAATPVLRSLRLVLASGVDYEVRVTVDAEHHSSAQLGELIGWLQDEGVANLVLQERRTPAGVADAASVAVLDGVGELSSGVMRRTG
jgi:pyruvate formate lyase activating enzyme